MSHEQKHPILQKLEEYLKNTPKEQLDEDWLDILKNSDMEAYYEKKYKDALERAKKLQETCDSTAVVGWCEYLFPELKESKDERIRKELIEQVAYITPNNDELDDELNTLPTYQKRIDKYRAWLEKQGEKDFCICIGCTNDKGCVTCENGNLKETKIEPKFKVGDWIVLPLGIIAHIESLNSTDYQVTTTDGKICDFKISKQDNYRLWSITDAKDGDLIYVSTEEKGIQAIFHEYKNDTIFFHCYLCGDFVQGGYMPIGSVELTYPLQKTHYNRFFEKMHEAGYEWDGEKKELKKIESLWQGMSAASKQSSLLWIRCTMQRSVQWLLFLKES